MRSLLPALLLICVSAIAQDNHAVQSSQTPVSPAGEPRIAEIATAIQMSDMAKKTVAEGWAMLRQGDAEIATRLFNKAAGLNPRSVDAYWGLGASTAQQRKFDVSIRAFERARELDTNNSRLAADAALAYTYFAMAQPKESGERAAGLKEALARFDEAIKLDPGLALTYANRAVAFAYKGEFDAAWKDVDKAEAIDKTSVDPNLVAYLSEKQPRPGSTAVAQKPADQAATAAAATIPVVPTAASAPSEAQPTRVQAVYSSPTAQQPAEQPVQPQAMQPGIVETGKVTPQPQTQVAVLQTAQAELPSSAKPESKPEPKSEQTSAVTADEAPIEGTAPAEASEPAAAPEPEAKPEQEKKLEVIGTPSRYKGPDKRQCLDLQTNEEIIRCVYPR